MWLGCSEWFGEMGYRRLLQLIGAAAGWFKESVPARERPDRKIPPGDTLAVTVQSGSSAAAAKVLRACQRGEKAICEIRMRTRNIARDRRDSSRVRLSGHAPDFCVTLSLQQNYFCSGSTPTAASEREYFPPANSERNGPIPGR
jgi:hypothetical protein